MSHRFQPLNFVGEFSASVSMILPVTNEIFVTVEISKFSICSSWSCVNLPSRRLNRTSCARAMSLASLRAALVSSGTFTSGFSNFLTTREALNLLPSDSILKAILRGPPTFTGLYDPALYNHFSRALSVCSRRRNLCIVCNFPVLSLHYSDRSFHNIT